MTFFKKIITVPSIAFLLFLTAPLFASDNASAYITYNYGLFAFSAALCISVCVTAGAVGQSSAAKVTLEGITRNPESLEKVFVPMILACALIESLVLFGLLIAFTILGKIA